MSEPEGTVRASDRALFHLRWALEMGTWKECAIVVLWFFNHGHCWSSSRASVTKRGKENELAANS